MEILLNFLIVCIAAALLMIMLIIMVITSIKADMRKLRAEVVRLRDRVEEGCETFDDCGPSPNFKTEINCDLSAIDPEQIREFTKQADKQNGRI